MKTFDQLFEELAAKVATRESGSGTVAAIDAGVHSIGKKVLEEAGEVWLAAEHESDQALAEEISRDPRVERSVIGQSKECERRVR